jgi:ligand-binding sensor domain-containing protein
MYQKFLLIIFLAGVLAVFADCKAQGFWQSLHGPFMGYVSNPVVNPLNGYMFVSDENFGIHRSTDNGHTWVHVTDKFTSVTRLAMDSSGNIFATVDKAIFKSTDNGITWDSIYNALFAILSIGISKQSFVYLGLGNVIYNEKNGYTSCEGMVVRSTDDGVSWETMDSLPPVVETIAVKDSIIVAEFNNGYNNGGSVEAYSLDAGSHWITSDSLGVKSFAIDPNGRIYAATAVGIYSSVDSGKSWQFTNLIGNTGNISCDQTGNIYVGMMNDIYRSSDRGNTWNIIDTNSVVLLGESFFGKSDEILTITTNGIIGSFDNGKNWEEVGIPSLFITSLAIDSSKNIFVASYNNDDHYVLPITTDGGASWYNLNSTSAKTFDGESPLVLTISNNEYIYAGVTCGQGAQYYGGVFRSTDHGNNWTRNVNGLTDHFITQIAVNKDNVIFAGGQTFGMFRSSNNAESWVAIDSGLWTDSLIGKEIVHSLCINTLSGYLFAGTGYGVFKSTNDGDVWSKLNFGVDDSVCVLTADLQGNIYAGTFHDGLYISSNNGNNWSQIGLSNLTIYSMAINQLGSIYVGTNQGIYHSSNEGSSWNSLNSGLTDSIARALYVDFEGYVYVGVNFGGVYRSIKSTTGIKEISSAIPSGLSLNQNYPNPFSPSTNISFSLPRYGYTSLKIYDALGKEVATAFSGNMNAGEYFIPWEAKDLPDGIYYYRLTSGATTETKKLVLMK